MSSEALPPVYPIMNDQTHQTPKDQGIFLFLNVYFGLSCCSDRRGHTFGMRRFLAVVICLMGLTEPRVAHACSVCIELPDASAADHILSAEIIVLAGSSSDKPFKFTVHKVIKGSADRIAATPEIPFLVDSVTRRVFRADPTQTVLLTYGPSNYDNAGRGFSRSWRRIFTMSPDRAAFLEKLQTSGQQWNYGKTDSSDRVLFFADYLWHGDQALHNIALVEIGRAPHELVRPIGDRSSTSAILLELNNLNRFAYRSVAIRLLGLKTDPKARSIVRSRYVKSLKSGGLNLYAWALAGIEADRETAIRAIDLAIQNPQKTQEDKKSLIRALTEVGSSRTEFRAQIVQILSDAITKDRQLALQVAIATQDWADPTLLNQFEVLAALDETDAATQFFLNVMLDDHRATD